MLFPDTLLLPSDLRAAPATACLQVVWLIMAATADPQSKLQLLADALAMEFSQSLASAQCAAALKRLLPGLEYLWWVLGPAVVHDGLTGSRFRLSVAQRKFGSAAPLLACRA
jgi:hypothetical protein